MNFSHLIAWLSSDNGLHIHAAILILLILGGIGFPIPEDIPLILAGVAASKDYVFLQAVFATCYVGVLIGDQTMYLIGYLFGKRMLAAGKRSPIFPSITEERVREVREGLRKKRLLYIFIGRHLFPIRSMTFVTAGALHIPFFEFLLADALAALVSVTVMVLLGYALGQSITPETVEHIAHQAHYYIVALILLGLLCFFLTKSIKRRRANKIE